MGMNGQLVHNVNTNAGAPGNTPRDRFVTNVYKQLRFIPFSVLLVWPFRSYQMGSAIKCRAGESMGATAYGHADFQLSDDIIAKVHVGHFTFYHASVVVNPKALCVLEDVFCSGFNGGENSTFVKHSDWVQRGHHDPYQHVLGERAQTNGSCFAMLAPYGLNQNNRSAMGSTDAFNTQNPVLLGREDCCGAPFAKMQNYLWKWKDIDNRNPERDDEEYHTRYVPQESSVNLNTFQTMQRVVNGSDTTGLNKTGIILNTDHWGVEGVYEGVKAARTGKLQEMKEQNYQANMTIV